MQKIAIIAAFGLTSASALRLRVGEGLSDTELLQKVDAGEIDIDDLTF